MTCEFVMSLPLKKQGTKFCGEPAFYLWKVKDNTVPMCKEHGEAVAGNQTHELEKITP